MQHRRAILTKYQLDPFEHALLTNGMLMRDVLKVLRRSSSDVTAGRLSVAMEKWFLTQVVVRAESLGPSIGMTGVESCSKLQ